MGSRDASPREWSRRLGPRMRFGTFGGLSRMQIVLLVIGAFMTLEVLSQGSTSWWGLPAGILVGVGFAVVVLKHRWGMPLADWMVKAAAFKTDRRRTWRAAPVGRSSEQLPREIGDVRIVSVRDRGSVVGMLRERRTLTAVALVELHSLGLFDSEQGRQLDAFRRVLDNLARDAEDDEFRVAHAIRRLPRAANAERQYVLQHADDPDSPQVQSMLAVLEETQAVSHEQEFWVAMRRSIRPEDDGEGRLRDQTAVALADRMRGLLDRLERADIAVKSGGGMLSPRDLARLFKDSFDPFGQDVRNRLEETVGAPGADPAAAWPDGRRRHVDCYETDSAFHATLWMRSWPAEGVGPGWLRPLTLDCDVSAMTVCTVLKPERSAVALGRIKRKRNRTASLRVFKHSHGKEDEEEHSDRAEFLDRQANDLVHRGASAWWWETYVTVSGRSREELDAAVRAARDACTDCGLTPVALRFGMAEAFTFTLPLCRGLRPENARL